jgi:hypothetical protein
LRRLALSIDGSATAFPRLRDIASWLEALGLRAWIPGRSLAAPEPDAVVGTLEGGTTAAVRATLVRDAPSARGDADLAGRDLVASDASIRERAIETLAATARWALAARASCVIVEPGSLEPFPAASDARAQERERDARLERLCRSLHAAARAVPLATFAIATPRDPPDWLTPATLEQVFAELTPKRSFHYWHDAGRAQAFQNLGHGRAAGWLDLHAQRCVGLDATDCVGTAAGLPAGSGTIDYQPLLDAVGAATWIALRAEPFPGPGPLLAAVRLLRGDDA